VTPPRPIAGIILSAGASRRMGAPKALLQFQGETFLDRLIRAFSAVSNPVIVVLGHHADQIRSGIERAQQVTFTVNPDPERGMLSSLQCGLDSVPASSEAVIFTPVDHPNVQESTLVTLAAQFQAQNAPVTIPEYGGKHGHPVCIARALIAELVALPASAQASDVIHRYKSQTSYIAVDDPGVVTDIDDRAAYEELVSARP
jgi:molybdenum cofactor cytidylyltransferase